MLSSQEGRIAESVAEGTYLQYGPSFKDSHCKNEPDMIKISARTQYSFFCLCTLENLCTPFGEDTNHFRNFIWDT